MKTILEKYRQQAKETFNRDFVSKKNVLKLSEEALLSDENKSAISDFMDDIDEDIKQFIWLFYYVQFECDVDFTKDKWVLNSTPYPDECEEKHPGMINAVTYLLARENLRKWTIDRCVPDDIGDAYFERYRYFVSMNQVSHNTYGLCRLFPFLYSYAKPTILRIGRLTYEATEYKDYCEMYENRNGERLFAALPNYSYDDRGLRDGNGNIPGYDICGDKLYAHIFDNLGRITDKPIEIDLNEYKKVLSPGDSVITIHIPEGKKLDIDDVKKSLSDAYELLTQYFEPFKNFVCHTWFIDPSLRGEVIKDSSNMAVFADMFDVISGPDNQNQSIYDHIFKVKHQPIENLIPQNAFQERVLNYVKNGNNLYWSYGVLKKEFEQ